MMSLRIARIDSVVFFVIIPSVLITLTVGLSIDVWRSDCLPLRTKLALSVVLVMNLAFTLLFFSPVFPA